MDTMHPFMKIVEMLARSEAEAIRNATQPKAGVIEMVETRPGHFERKKK